MKALSATARSVSLRADKNWLNGATTSNCAGGSLDYGVIDRRDGGRGVFWLKYYAKAAMTPGASQARLNLPVEVFAKVANDGKPTITVLSYGKPAADAAVVIEDKDGKPGFEGKTGADGTLLLPLPDGPLAVRVLVTDSKPGTHDGKRYDLVRSYSTLTINDPSAKTLTRMLHESFGDMHDVITGSAFIGTVMGSRLTRAQVEAHLQQRALVHAAVDDILNKARIEPPVFGRPQRQVTDLLRADMRAMGAPWPAAKDAWPLTKDFLTELRDSAAKGPYFALGVFHVYYGGITHGGRPIGAMITRQTKVELTYYQKSDGYEDYARRIDEITDPAAQREMIRGADLAYKYLLAINNVDFFKASK